MVETAFVLSGFDLHLITDIPFAFSTSPSSLQLSAQWLAHIFSSNERPLTWMTMSFTLFFSSQMLPDLLFISSIICSTLGFQHLQFVAFQTSVKWTWGHAMWKSKPGDRKHSCWNSTNASMISPKYVLKGNHWWYITQKCSCLSCFMCYTVNNQSTVKPCSNTEGRRRGDDLRYWRLFAITGCYNTRLGGENHGIEGGG